MLTVAAAIGAGVVAGVFFAFSTFVMPALRRLPAADGLGAMQAINSAAPASPLFMVALLGTGVLCVLDGVSALGETDEPAAIGRLVGCLLYLGCVAITAGYHVPRNDRLALVDPGDTAAADRWRQYVREWTRWNHVRTATSLLAGVVLVVVAGAG